MENTHEFHGKAPNKEQFEKAMQELNEKEMSIKKGKLNE
jgi:hypothetical protein